VQIAPEGLESADELLMYRPVPPSTDLSAHPFAVRVRAFGEPSPAPDGFGVSATGHRFAVTPRNLRPAAIGLLVIPGLALMVVAVGAASGVRDHRFGVLRALGAPRAALVRLSMLEVLFLALPGTLLGAGLWRLAVWVTRYAQHPLPLVDRHPLPGDLAVPVSWLAPTVVALALAPSLAAGVSGWVRYGRPARSVRPEATAVTISPWRLAPVGLLAFGVGLRLAVGGTAGGFAFALAALATLASLPLLLPQVVRPVGALLRRVPTVPTLLAGRGIEWDAIRSSRPVLSIGILVAIALGVVGVRAIILTEAPQATAPTWTETSAVLINHWSQDEPAELAAMAEALPGTLVVRAANPETTIRLAATCAQLQPYFPQASCDPADPRALPETISIPLSRALYRGPELPVVLVDAEAIETNSFLAVIGTGEYGPFVEDVRSAARRLLLRANINDNTSEIEEPASLLWLVAGFGVAVVVLALGALVAAVDRFLAVRTQRAHLLHIGLVPRQLGQIDALQFLTVLLTAISLGAALGILAVTQLVTMTADANTPVPWDDLRSVLLAAVGGAGGGTLLVLLFGVRRFAHGERPA
jgi:predicted lysophospholipase L1 biosynthesis ABC-type transport system permease subunit